MEIRLSLGENLLIKFDKIISSLILNGLIILNIVGKAIVPTTTGKIIRKMRFEVKLETYMDNPTSTIIEIVLIKLLIGFQLSLKVPCRVMGMIQ